MNRNSKWHSVVSLVVSLGLLMQLIAPLVLAPVSAQVSPNPATAVGATAVAPALSPTTSTPTNPLALSRIQSSYTAPGTVVITYTVHNTLPPVIIPPAPVSATITATIAALDGFNPLNDPNTVRNVLLTNSLTGAGTLADVYPPADQQGGDLAWNLGDIAPSQSATAVLTLTLTANPNNVQLLDNGAAAYGHTAGKPVSASATPALVNPASFAQWLIWTLDANIYDDEMLVQAGQLSHDPAQLFATVRSMGYELYDGSLRGTRGTLWSEAGNSTDQSSLLIAMLRASGIPSRYRHGTLSQSDAQTLIASMFPEPTQYVGHLDESLQTADPVNDPALITQAQDHWWVEAYLPGDGWTDLDPSFPAAQIGDSFATPATNGTDRIAELPDSTRHKVTIRLKAEDYYPLNLTPTRLDVSYPLSHTFRTVELTAEPVAFSHLVHTENQGGPVFANTIHTYTPYLLIGDREIFGEPYQDILTNFPLGTIFHTAVWLQFDLTAPNGDVNSYEREIADKIGYEARVNGGNSSFTLTSDDSQLVTDFDIYTTGFWPNIVPAAAIERVKADALAQAQNLNADAQRLQELLNLDDLTPAEQQEFSVLRARFQINAALLLGNLSLSFAEMADRMVTETSAGLFIKAYYDTPRLVITGLQPNGSAAAFSMDLRHTAVRTIPYPGQATNAAIGFNITKGFIESGIEGRVLGDAIGQPVLTTARIGIAAQEQGIQPIYLASDNLHLLDQLELNAQANARITAAAAAGKLVIIPAAKVQIDGGYHTGWWEIDPTTGETIGVLEDGLHGALEYLFTIAFMVIDGPLADFMLGVTAYTWGFVADRFDKAVGDGSFDQDSYDQWIGAYETTLSCVGAIASGGTLAGIFCGSGIGGAATGVAADPFSWGQKAAEAYLTSVVQYDPPLGSVWMALNTFTPAAQNVTTATLPINATLPTGNLNATLTTEFTVVSGTLNTSYTSPGAAYHYESLSLANGTLQDETGSVIGSGAITAVPGILSATNATVTLSGDGQMGFYAAALPNLGNGAHFTDVQANLTNNNLALTLRNTAVTLNDVTYNGDFTIQAQSAATLSGSGPLAAANHASSTAVSGSDLSLLLDPATGSATLGGQPLNVAAGLGLTGYSGNVNISDNGSATQQVTLNGTAVLFTLSANPAASTTTPETAVTFTPAIASNFNSSFALTLTAPAGWTAAMNGNQATITPAPGAAIGEYIVFVTACPASAPLVCQTAVHTITILPFDGFTLTVQPDPLTTIPMGNVLADDLRPGNTNSGQSQIPGAAYTIILTNTANASHTYDLNVSGLPVGWTLLANQAPGETSSSLTLPPGETGYLGLYVNPTDGQLPAPGTSHTIQVTAVSDTTTQQSDTIPFTMPAVPFNYVAVQPPVLYLTSTAVADIALSLTNVGNATGDFPLSARSNFAALDVVSTLNDVAALAPDATANQTVTVGTTDAPIGSVYPLFLDSPAPGGVYTQTATLIVQVTSQRTGQIMQAGSCAAGNVGYSASVQSLGMAVQELETWCELGNCPLPLRDNVVAAAQAVANNGSRIPYTTAAASVTTAAANLANQSDNTAILLALDDLATAVTSLGAQVCEVEEHRPRLRWNPISDAILSGDSASYDLELTNLGTVATTYALTLSLPTGQNTQAITLPAGQTTTLPVPVTTPPDGYHLLNAVAVPTGPSVDLFINPGSQARLNVVDRFVQVTAVTADPPFVDVGVSSTTLSVEIANIANVARNVVADTAVLAPDGSPQTSLNPTLNLLAGNPRTYELGALDTSGWAEGVYTITVNLLDESSVLVPDGFGYGYLGVGQSLTAQMSNAPQIVPPGTVTVTTIITTAIHTELFTGNSEQFVGRTIYDAPYWNVEREEWSTVDDQSSMVNESAAMAAATAVGANQPSQMNSAEEPLPVEAEEISRPLTYTPAAELPAANDPLSTDSAVWGDTKPFTSDHTLFTINDSYFRIEQDDAAIATTGTWSSHNQTRASGGSYWRNGVAGSTAVYTFDGDWLNLGFMGGSFSGYVEIAINGSSQGTFDLYRNEDNTPISFVFPNLGAGPHSVTMTVTGSSNPFSLNTRVQLDYIDYWDSVPLGDGLFEETAVRVLRSGGWTDVAYANASGGGYMRSTAATAWLPFDGDSFTYHALAYSSGGKAQLFVDGTYLTTVDLYHPNNANNAITRTFSYEGFGAGGHILQINSYRNTTTFDALTTPGIGPFIDPNPPVSGITRYEEDHPTLRYNGVPYSQTAQSWARISSISSNRASDGQYIYSAAAGDTISFDFAGRWVGVGFATDLASGQAEIAIDGNLVAQIDLYSREDDTTSYYFDELSEGAHTITVTVLGTHHPNATGSRIHLDFFDVWDGQPLPDGAFEETDARLFYSAAWGQTLDAGASGGSFANAGSSNATAWIPFTGDSITFQAWARPNYHTIKLSVDGEALGPFDMYSRLPGPRAFSFAGFGDGPHVLEVRSYRSNVTLDAFTTPATDAPYIAPTPSGVIRLEEDHPDLRYNGYPYRTMPQSWATQSSINRGSGTYNTNTSTTGNTLSLDFAGRWVGVGFSTGGVVEIFIDDVSRGLFDTSVGEGDITSIYYDDLISGTHTISVTAVSGNLRPDFIDIWDGQTTDDGWYNANLEDSHGRFHFSNRDWWGRVENQYAHEGDYVSMGLPNANPNMWFTFVGSDLTLLGFNRIGATLHVAIDGQPMGVLDMTAEFSDQPTTFHFPNLGDGPHTVQIHTEDFGRLDAFEVNPDGFYSYAPQITWHDDSATEELDPALGTGFITTIGIGDLNGDGVVELVAPGRNGRLYVYRGDGQDTGNGTPIQWTTDLVGQAAEPALGDLDGDSNAEIIISGDNGLFAFRHDGTVLWQEPGIQAHTSDSGGSFGWGGPTLGNLDNDADPEIVIAASEDALYVLDHLGNILDSDPIGRWPSVPVLADITGDGTLEIISAQGHTLNLYEYDALNGLEIAWSYTLTQTTSRSGVFGSPAVADLTGDGQPEIIINWGHRVETLQADGSLLWSYYTGSDSHYRPSPITIADVTGDGQPNIITASAINAGFLVFEHMLMVLTKEGTLVWQQTVADSTASASGVAAQDLTGNGVWEILWNGLDDGFLVIRGSDGKRLFNEPFTGSGTIMDYPSMGDVDGDGVADVVVAGHEGIFVISHVGHWVDSRPVWNQHNYHVTNINDDWSIPFTQPRSWELHNTYRTQTPDRNPAPAYSINVHYTAGIDQISVLTPTISLTPTAVTPPTYTFSYRQEWYQPVVTITLDSQVDDLQPGEVRQVAQGARVTYTLPGGQNSLTLPPLFVTGAVIAEMTPGEQTAVPGQTLSYTITLFNPAATPDNYSLTAAGLPADWSVSLPPPVAVPAHGQTTAVLALTVPDVAELREHPFVLAVSNGSGGAVQLGGSAWVQEGVLVAITAVDGNLAPVGQPISHTLTITNLESASRTYDLSVAGTPLLVLPPAVVVPANSSVDVPFTATPSDSGSQPFTVYAIAQESGAVGSATAVIQGTGMEGVSVTLTPPLVEAGPGGTAVFTVTVQNLGSSAHTYDLNSALPVGWNGRFEANGQPVDELFVATGIYNVAEVTLLVTPEETAVIGSYPISVTATAQTNTAVSGTAAGQIDLNGWGVMVEILDQNVTIDPNESFSWDVRLTNSGENGDTFSLTAAGLPVGADGAFSSETVTLAAGASTVVQYTAGPFTGALPQAYTFEVLARSVSETAVVGIDRTLFTLAAQEGLAAAWLPASQTVSNTFVANYMLVLTNTGNTAVPVTLNLSGTGLTFAVPLDNFLLPPGTTAMIPVTVQANGAGEFVLTGTAVGNVVQVSETALLWVEVETIIEPPPTEWTIYLPILQQLP